MAASPTEHPVFVLSTVVFPGGALPLRIFEPRYLDMVSYCMREQTPFVVCTGEAVESGGFAAPRSMGTTARIIDFDRLDDGALGITAQGEQRVALDNARCAARKGRTAIKNVCFTTLSSCSSNEVIPF